MEKEKNATKSTAEEAVTSSAPVVSAENLPPLTAEQMAWVQQMIEGSKRNSNDSNAFSVYGQRDPKKIETVNVKRFVANDGVVKFVVGFKNHQNDPFKKVPKYTTYEFDPVSKRDLQPYITLLLSDGTTDSKGGLVQEEKHVRLLDYVDYRERYDAKVIRVEKREIIEDHGILGSSAIAGEIDASGKPIHHSAVKQETKREEMVFFVELPGFEDPVEFINDPTGPLG